MLLILLLLVFILLLLLLSSFVDMLVTLFYWLWLLVSLLLLLFCSLLLFSMLILKTFKLRGLNYYIWKRCGKCVVTSTGFPSAIYYKSLLFGHWLMGWPLNVVNVLKTKVHMSSRVANVWKLFLFYKETS